MTRLGSGWFVLAAALFAPCLLAQGSDTPGATPPAAALPTIKFDVVSFKPCEMIDLRHKQVSLPANGDSIGEQCQTIRGGLLDVAFGGPAYQVQGEPEWLDTEAYDFHAKVAPEDVATWQAMKLPARRLMVLAMLEDTLHFKFHLETKSRPVYDLVVAKGGPKLTESKPDPDAPAGTTAPSDVHWVGAEEAAYTNTNMMHLAAGLAARLDRDVIDKTELKGSYDFHVNPLPFVHYNVKTSDVESTNIAPILDGVKSLGLRLEPGKADIIIVVVDHIDRPAEN